MWIPASMKTELACNDLHLVAADEQVLTGVCSARSCVLFIVVSADSCVYLSTLKDEN